MADPHRPAERRLRLVSSQDPDLEPAQDTWAVSAAAARAVAPWPHMLKELEGRGQATVDQVIEGLQPDGAVGSAAWEALHEAVAEAGRADEWNETVAGVREAFQARGLEGADAIAPAFLAAVFRELMGTAAFTGAHYVEMIASWRTNVGWPHPEDESHQAGERPMFGCGPSEEPQDWPAHDGFFRR